MNEGHSILGAIECVSHFLTHSLINPKIDWVLIMMIIKGKCCHLVLAVRPPLAPRRLGHSSEVYLYYFILFLNTWYFCIWWLKMLYPMFYYGARIWELKVSIRKSKVRGECVNMSVSSSKASKQEELIWQEVVLGLTGTLGSRVR